MQSVDLNYWLPGDILQKADKMSMAHSLEVRVPFLDKDVWTLAAGLPKEAKIADGTTKDIFRKAVSKYIPQDTDGKEEAGISNPHPCVAAPGRLVSDGERIVHIKRS